MVSERLSITVLGGVGTLVLLGVVGLGWILLSGGLGAPTSIEQSIAVLPFDDLSPEGDQRYFVEGLSEEIINALSQIRDLKVAQLRRATRRSRQRGGKTWGDSLGRGVDPRHHGGDQRTCPCFR